MDFIGRWEEEFQELKEYRIHYVLYNNTKYNTTYSLQIISWVQIKYLHSELKRPTVQHNDYRIYKVDRESYNIDDTM